jgi:uncharacterized membrane protein
MASNDPYSSNPYAPSKASMSVRSGNAEVSSEVSVWRDGKAVVTLHDASLPNRCVKCNAPADPPTKERTLYYVHPAVYLLFLTGFLILLIVYMIVRKKAEVNPGLCESHKKSRAMAIAGAWFACLGGLFFVFAGIGADSGGKIGFGLLLILASIVIGVVWGRMIHVKKITKDEVRLGGFSREYLDSLPDYPY